jgi:hypothetical protein
LQVIAPVHGRRGKVDRCDSIADKQRDPHQIPSLRANDFQFDALEWQLFYQSFLAAPIPLTKRQLIP